MPYQHIERQADRVLRREVQQIVLIHHLPLRYRRRLHLRGTDSASTTGYVKVGDSRAATRREISS
jgi:hypothetical protein